MAQSKEATLWRVLGTALIAGGGIPLIITALQVARTNRFDSEVLVLDVWCGVTALLGLTALVAARITSARDGAEPGQDWVWTFLAFGALPLGAAVFDIEWQRTLNSPATGDQQAVLMIGAFIFAAGRISLVGERAMHRLHTRAINRVLSEVEQSRAEAAQARIL